MIMDDVGRAGAPQVALINTAGIADLSHAAIGIAVAAELQDLAPNVMRNHHPREELQRPRTEPVEEA